MPERGDTVRVVCLSLEIKPTSALTGNVGRINSTNAEIMEKMVIENRILETNQTSSLGLKPTIFW